MAKKNEVLKLDDSVKESKRGEAILGRLSGPCADFLNPTRNGRQYDEALWEKVFDDEIVNEYFEAGGIPGELDHPTDRLDTCSEKIAIMMPEKPTKDEDGHLIATFDILDTPNGRIVYTLAKYGYKLGISSRGNGETYKADDGTDHVEEDSYDFRAFDIVLLPAVKAARLKMVESLQNGKSFKQAINESLSKATPDEKRIMQETLQNLKLLEDNKIDSEEARKIKLKIDSLKDTLDWALEKGYQHRITSILDQIDELNKQLKNKEEYNHESVIDNKSDMAVDSAEANMLGQLQESLLAQQKLEAKVTELQEKLSVCYAKEAKYEEDLSKYKSAVQNLSKQASNVKALQTKVESLESELKTKDTTLNESRVISNKQLANIKTTSDLRIKSLTETLSTKNVELQNAKRRLSELQEQLKANNSAAEEKLNNLNEQLAEQKKNFSIKTAEYSNKLSNANNLVEQYRKTAKTAVSKYIESQAVRLGVKTEEIQNKLPSNYSFNDIDRICEELSRFKLKVSDLPFNVEQFKKAKITESKNTLIPKVVDDTVDESLFTLANTIIKK